ncbi:hypothetical protein SDC9_112162 [bioreactor metagenome]|uniref:Uncharacterized protein n=1 Tax=bioreactor metagenome TaxID=1076179 RepID=A0A645BIS8_9ZZZZ
MAPIVHSEPTDSVQVCVTAPPRAGPAVWHLAGSPGLSAAPPQVDRSQFEVRGRCAPPSRDRGRQRRGTRPLSPAPCLANRYRIRDPADLPAVGRFGRWRPMNPQSAPDRWRSGPRHHSTAAVLASAARYPSAWLGLQAAADPRPQGRSRDVRHRLCGIEARGGSQKHRDAQPAVGTRGDPEVGRWPGTRPPRHPAVLRACLRPRCQLVRGGPRRCRDRWRRVDAGTPPHPG